MESRSKKSQVTIFIIIVLLLVITVVSLVLVSRYNVVKTTRQEALDTKESILDIQPIKNFVTECLSTVSKDGLLKIGRQGGYLFESQGGTLIDYLDIDEGLFYVNFENSRVVYNILKPRFPIGKFSPSIPNYPWKTFPYEDESSNEELFKVQGIFGVSNLPNLDNFFGPHSIQSQLTTFISNNIDNCLDFSVFETQGFSFSAADKNITTNINENDVVFNMKFPITIENLVSGEKTTLNEFLVRHDVRFGKLRRFTNILIAADISDVKFDITNISGFDSFSIEVRKNVYGNDDLIIITDQKSSFGNVPYRYIFARKNRNPAMLYLRPVEVALPLTANGGFPTVTVEDLIVNYPAALKAFDPDEDLIDISSFSINPNTPRLISSETDFTIQVTDGELIDSQIITVKIE